MYMGGGWNFVHVCEYKLELYVSARVHVCVRAHTHGGGGGSLNQGLKV